MTKDEALLLALEYLEASDNYLGSLDHSEPIAAIKEALAQPEQEPVVDYSCNVCSNKPDADGCLEHGSGCYTQSEDGGGIEFIPEYVFAPAAPVQDVVPEGVIVAIRNEGLTLVKDLQGYRLMRLGKIEAQATPPAAQREWVELTEEEKLVAIWTDGTFGAGVAWAEDKLKEKNT